MGLSGLLCRRLFRVVVMAQPGARAYCARNTKTPKEPLRHIKIREREEDKLKGRGRGWGPEAPVEVHVQVVAAGSRDTGTVLHVFSDKCRYLFNCGEGVQRLMIEHKLKLSHVDHILITRMDWGNVGGLPGVFLNMRDLGAPKCLLSGPPELKPFLAAIKTFCGNFEKLTIDVQPQSELFSDQTMSVTQVPVSVSRSPPESLSRQAAADESHSDPRLGRTSPDLQRRFSTRFPPSVIAYICKLHDRKGKLLLEKAEEFNFPLGTRETGELLQILKAGKSIVCKDKEIFPADIMSPDIPGLIFIVVECPSEDFITPITENMAWKRYLEGEGEAAVALVIHMTPEHVLQQSTYRRWMKRFGPSTEHLIMNEHTSTVHNLSCYKAQSQLHLIHPDVFPQLQQIRPKDEASEVPAVRAECLLKYQMRPEVGWERKQVVQNHTSEYVEEAMKVPGFGKALEEFRSLLQSDDTSAKEGSMPYPEVVFLGTGAALPMKNRNVSSTLVHVSPDAVMMLDCGEGTFGQLHRHYGDGVDDVLSRLSAVFLSHIHADHHAGILRVVLERARALASLGKPFSPLLVIGPIFLMTWLNEYDEHCQKVLHNISYISSKEFLENAYVCCPKTRDLIASLLNTYQLEKFQTCYVNHCKDAFGCAIVHQSGWKLVFSGDTMPCEALIKMGKGANLVIHEATLEDGLEQEAYVKAHSTVSQAISVGMSMDAEFMILNHFSQRYSKMPLMSDCFTSKVGIAFDHMRIKMSDLRILPKLMGPIKALFAEDILDLEKRKQKRKQKRQLQHPEVETVASDADDVAIKRELDDADVAAKRELDDADVAAKRELDDADVAANVKRLRSN